MSRAHIDTPLAEALALASRRFNKSLALGVKPLNRMLSDRSSSFCASLCFSFASTIDQSTRTIEQKQHAERLPKRVMSGIQLLFEANFLQNGGQRHGWRRFDNNIGSNADVDL